MSPGELFLNRGLSLLELPPLPLYGSTFFTRKKDFTLDKLRQAE
jgi:hypothetical protein